MRGMELWRPDWNKIMCGMERDDDSELVSVTRGTARLAQHALQLQMERDYYHNHAAAEHELFHVLEPK